MQLQIFSNVEHQVPENFFQKVFQNNLEELSSDLHFKKWAKSDLEINLILTDDDEVQSLNKEWRKKNTTTDVLSFPYFDVLNDEVPTPSFVIPFHSTSSGQASAGIPSSANSSELHGIPAFAGMTTQEQNPFGEIFISLPQCQRQADFLEHSLEKELSVLFTHSILHLFGFDHIEEKDFLEMNNWEKRIEKRLENEIFDEHKN